MIEELVKVHTALRPHVLQLHIRWAQFRFLFTVSDRRMTILSDTAPGFFAILRDVLRDDAFMSISRLTDKANTRTGDNLTLASLIEIAEKSGIEELMVTARPLFEKICELAQNMRKWRNKWLAHTDYKQALLEKPLPEYSVQRGQVDSAISMIIELMNLFAKQLQQPLLGEALPIVVGDADVLARILESFYESESGA